VIPVFIFSHALFMPLTREQKEQVVEQVEQDITGAMSAVFVSYNALNITDMGELRDKLFESDCSMRVVPKRLLRLAAKQAKVEFDPTAHEGQIAVIWGADPVAPAKVLYDFAKKRDNVQLLAGVLEGGTLTFEQVTSLAKLPSREELLGKLVGTLAGVPRGLVGVLAGVPRAAVYALQAIAEQKEKAT
jgi:large subunit ribosomal protein L10